MSRMRWHLENDGNANDESKNNVDGKGNKSCSPVEEASSRRFV